MRLRGKSFFLLALFSCIILFLSAMVAREAGEKSRTLHPLPPGLGDPAPEIALRDTSGTSVLRLSELRGYYVLLDFWASWCRPCRMENPYVVEAWKQFGRAKFQKGKGFRIFSVSLDNNLLAWKNAIRDDKLEWRWHVSDLQGWKNTAAKTYGVTKIPSNFLLDPKGIIIAQNLRGPALELELRKYVKD